MSMQLTQKLFCKHEKFVRRVLNLDQAQWNRARTIIIQNLGIFDEDATFCGPGWLGDKVVPDLCFKFAGFCHDGIVLYLETAEDPAMGIDKDFADSFFYAIMLSICDQCPVSGIFICDEVLPAVYYKAVDVFGKYEYDPEKINKLTVIQEG